MENLEKLNLKIRIQILDSDNQILIQSTVNQTEVKDVRIYTNVSLVDETYLMLLDELKQKLNQN
jgi:hypothetical protein